MKILKNILNWFVFIFGGKGKICDEAVKDGLCDFSGQGNYEKYRK